MLLTDDSCWASSKPTRKKRRAPAQRLFRQQARGISTSFLGNHRKPPERCLLGAIASQWSQLVLSGCVCIASTLKKMIHFIDIPPQQMTGYCDRRSSANSSSKDNRSGITWMCSCSYISSRSVMGNDMIYIWNYLRYEQAPAGSPSVVDARVYRQTADDVRVCAHNDCRFLTNCRLWFYWCLTSKTDAESLHIRRGHRLWTNVFSIEPRSKRAS